MYREGTWVLFHGLDNFTQDRGKMAEWDEKTRELRER